MQDQENKPRKPFLYDYSRYTALGFQMIALVLAGFYGGDYLDRKFSMSRPVFKLIFILLAIFISLFSIIRTFNKKKDNGDDIK